MGRKLFKKLLNTRKKRILLGICLFLLTVIVTCIIILQSQAFKSNLIKRVDRYLQAHYNLSLSTESVDYSLSQLAFTIDKVQVKAISEKDSPLKLFSARRLYIDLSFTSLFSGKIHLQQLHISQPRIVFSQVKQQPVSSSSVKPAKDAPGKKTLAIRIDDFQLDNGSIVFNSRLYALQASLSNIIANAQYLEKEQTHKGFIKSQNGEIRFSQSNLNLKNLLLEFNFDSDSIQIDRLSIDSNLLALEASGWIRDYQHIPRYLFEVRSSFRLDQVQPLLGLDNRYAGNLTMTGSVQGEGERLSFTSKINGQDVILYDIPVAKFEAAFESDKTAFSVKNLNLNIADGHLGGTLNIAFSSQLESSLALRWDSINLLRLGKSFPRLPLLLSSKTRGQLSARWQALERNSINAEGDIAFDSSDNISPPRKEINRLDGRIKFKASNGKIEIHPSDLILNDSSFSFYGNLDKSNTLNAKFRLKADDLAEIETLFMQLKRENDFSQFKKLQPFQLAGSVFVSGNIAGPLTEPKVSLELDGTDIAFKQMQIPALKGALSYGEKRINISRFLMAFKQGRIKGEGYISYDHSKNIFGKRTEFTLAVKELNTAPIIASLPVEHDIQGVFSGEAKLSGSLSDLTAEFKTSISQLMIYKEDFLRIEIEGHYAHQHIQLTKLGVFKGNGALEGTLGLDLAGRSYAVNITGKTFDLANFKSLDPEKNAIAGVINLHLEGQGTFDKPKFILGILLENPRAFNTELEFIKLEADSDGTVIKSRLHTPKGKTTIQANLLLQEPYIVQGHFTTTALDLVNTIRSRDEGSPTSFSSEITTSVAFSIPFKNWEDSTIFLSMERLTLNYKELGIQNSHPIVLKLENGEVIVQDFRLSGQDTKFTISGRLPIKTKKGGQIKAVGSIQLQFIEPFLPRSTVNGTLVFQSEINGSIAKPHLNAQIELKEGRLISPSIPYTLHDFALLAKIDKNSVNLDKFSIGVDEGNISAHGRFSLTSLFSHSLQPSSSTQEGEKNDIEVTLTGLNLANLAKLMPSDLTEEFGGLIEGTLHFRGNYSTLSQLEIEGELNRLLFSLSQFKLENDDKIQFSLKDNTFRLDQLGLSGGNSSIHADGRIDLAQEPEIDVWLSAELDSAVLAPFFENIVLGGIISFDLNFKGPLANPTIEGSAEIKEGFFQLQDYPVLATDIKGNIQFSESTVTISSLQGIANGGTVKLQGNVNYRAFKIESAKVEMTAERVQVNYPEGLQAQSNGTLLLEGKDNKWLLSGDMKITQAYYGTNIYLGGELLNRIRFQRARIKSDIPPLLRNINLNVGISTVNSLVIDNNLANLELIGNIQILGTVSKPRLSGRVINLYVGEIVFGDRTYEVEQASIDFLGSDPLDGRLNLVAHTNITHKYDELKITLTLSGPITNLNYSLSSFPPRSQGELASLLITGYGTEKLKSDAANIIGNQMILYFTSPLASPVTEKIKNFLKAEEVSIEPINIATEEDPGARFTFRKGLIRQVDIVYSIDVGNTQRQTWILDYNLNRNFFIQSFHKDDGSYGSSLSHRFTLGKQIPKSQAPFETQSRQFIIKEVKFEGNLVFPQKSLAKKTRILKTDSPFNYRDLRKAIENLIVFYKENKYLSAIINPAINYDNNANAFITLNISAQKPASIEYLGDPIPQKLKREVIDSWNGRLPENMALAEAKNRITNDLKSRGYYEAEVGVKKNSQSEQSIYTFSIKHGPRYHIRKFTVTGKNSISPDSLQKTILKIPRTKGKGLWVLLYDFKRAEVRLEELYAENGYLSAVISRPQINVDRKRRSIDIALPIEEGPQSRVYSVVMKGNQTFQDDELKKGLRLTEKSIYRPSLLSEDSNHLFNYYRSKGYQDVNISVEIVPQPESPDINFVYNIRERELHTIAEIEISGNQQTPDYFIRRELLFNVGDALNMKNLILSQKKLYDLSIFKTVNIHRQPLEGKVSQEKILVEIQENPRFAVTYGMRYNSEEKFEGFGQLNFINIFGRGRKGLIRYRQNKRQKDLRFSLTSPYLFGKRFNTLHSFHYTEEIEAAFKSEEIGYTLQQEVQLPFDFSLSYLYRLNRIHTYELEPIGPFPFDITLFLSELQTFFVRDTRINKLNANQGSFFSLSLTHSPEFIGSDLTYISLFCQYSLYKILSSQFIWASNYRIGLADAFDQVLIPSKRFYAGGGNSIRGFKRDMVGPYDPLFQRAEGGEALFIMNQEMRFPIFKSLGGVIFYDIGNVYKNLGDFNPLDVRHSIGLGFRLNTPAALIRIDYGINLSPRMDESRGVFFLSIGQAF